MAVRKMHNLNSFEHHLINCLNMKQLVLDTHMLEDHCGSEGAARAQWLGQLMTDFMMPCDLIC